MRWAGTFLCLLGMICSAANAYPLNLAFSAVGSSLWCAHGLRSRDVPLWVVEAAAVLIAAVGLAAWVVRSLTG